MRFCKAGRGEDKVPETFEDSTSFTLEKVRRHVRILVDIGRIAGSARDLNHLLDLIVVQVARAVEINHVKVLQYRPREADFLVAAGIGWKEGVVRSATLSADLQSAPGRAFRTAEPATIKDFSQQSEYVLSDFLRGHGIVSLTNVPIMIDGAAWGVLEVDSTVPRDFGEDTTDFLMAAGTLVGSYLQRQLVQSVEAERLLAQTQVQSREVLLREMQHRVKNNFQLILASVAFQKRRYLGDNVHCALDHITSRINAIALAHDQLSLKERGQIVRLADYIRALCDSIGRQAETVDIDVETDDLELAIERTLPLGLILNEVATNSIKHAFGPEGGSIKVKLSGGIGYGEARLTITDNGRGMKDVGKGSGLGLIALLARQIGGSVNQSSSDNGTVTSVTFPLIS